jgi:4-amino-4-deoxy-L-arabinose transferase-like glycosyltransferase
LKTSVSANKANKAFLAVLAFSFALNLAGIWWGLPSRYGWAVDELTPSVILSGIETRFSGDWHQPAYPPLHYYLLALTYLPALAFDLVDPASIEAHTWFFLFGRVLSLVMAATILLLLYQLGRDRFDSKAGLFAVLAMSLAAPFVYYAKTANLEIPLLFWFFLSLVFFLRVWSRGELSDYLGFAITAVCAMGTKDQAYAFYVLPVAAFLGLRLRSERSLHRLLLDRRRLGALAVSAIAFLTVHNVAFNYQGFVHHFQEILWHRSNYGRFQGTIGDQLPILAQTLRHLGFTLGVPLAAAAAAGLILALREEKHRETALWILLFGASYYLFFVAPVLAPWLRYALPLAALSCLFAGLALSRLWARGWAGRLLAAAALAYSLGRAVSMDLLLLSDTRYAAERWLEKNVSKGAVVGYMGPEYYLPRLHRLSAKRLRPTETVLAREKPDYLVLNPEYAARFPPGTREHDLFARLAAGRTRYGLVLSLAAREGSPSWSLLDFDGIFANNGKVSPPIEIYALAD